MSKSRHHLYVTLGWWCIGFGWRMFYVQRTEFFAIGWGRV